MIAEIVEEEEGAEDSHNMWLTILSNGYRVSTIYLTPDGKELDEAIMMLMGLFGVKEEELDRPGRLGMEGDYETMVFHESRGAYECAFARYDTETEARAGHLEMVERWRRMPEPS